MDDATDLVRMISSFDWCLSFLLPIMLGAFVEAKGKQARMKKGKREQEEGGQWKSVSRRSIIHTLFSRFFDSVVKK